MGMDELCLQPGDEPYDSSKVIECQKKGSKFRDIQQQTARFVAAQQRLDAAKLSFQSEITKASNEFAADMEVRGSKVVNDAPSSEKVGKFKEIMKENLKEILSGGRAQRQLNEEATLVETEANKLRETLDTVLPEITEFLDECNILMTGVGKKNESLLDLCSVNS